ncbi:MAG: 4Fe-4S dicluster domain-containing protein [Anaerolineales bacterium]|nr:4Fe-4S dicluster domain-containing protein [Anaerolineales bacterium]
MKRIQVRRELCSGCRACEIACVVRNEGRFGTAQARIRVTKDEPFGLDQPHVCIQCQPAPCVEECPTDALYIDPITGAVFLRSAECINCSFCEDACPYGMVALHPETMLALICDLCSGDPMCVKRCATGAIIYAENGSEG